MKIVTASLFWCLAEPFPYHAITINKIGATALVYDPHEETARDSWKMAVLATKNSTR